MLNTKLFKLRGKALVLLLSAFSTWSELASATPLVSKVKKQVKFEEDELDLLLDEQNQADEKDLSVDKDQHIDGKDSVEEEPEVVVPVKKISTKKAEKSIKSKMAKKVLLKEAEVEDQDEEEPVEDVSLLKKRLLKSFGNKSSSPKASRQVADEDFYVIEQAKTRAEMLDKHSQAYRLLTEEKRSIEKMVNDSLVYKPENSNFDAKTGAVTKVVVIGAGGGTCNTIKAILQEEIMRRPYENLEIVLVAMNTDADSLNSVRDAFKKYQSTLSEQKKIGYHLYAVKVGGGHYGAGQNAILGAQLAENSSHIIEHFVRDAAIVCIPAALGGGTGSGFTPKIAEIAKRSGGALVLSLLTMPFSSDGAGKCNIAATALESTKQKVDAYQVINNDDLINESNLGETLKEKFGKANKVVSSHILGTIISIITNKTGQVNIDTADLINLLQGKKTAVIATARAEGKGATTKALLKCLKIAYINKGKDFVYDPQSMITMIERNGGPTTDDAIQRDIFIKTHFKPKVSQAPIKNGDGDCELLAPGTVRVSIIIAGYTENPSLGQRFGMKARRGLFKSYYAFKKRPISAAVFVGSTAFAAFGAISCYGRYHLSDSAKYALGVSSLIALISMARLSSY